MIKGSDFSATVFGKYSNPPPTTPALNFCGAPKSLSLSLSRTQNLHDDTSCHKSFSLGTFSLSKTPLSLSTLRYLARSLNAGRFLLAFRLQLAFNCSNFVCLIGYRFNFLKKIRKTLGFFFHGLNWGFKLSIIVV